MARTLGKLAAIAEGLGEFLEAERAAQEAYDAPCACCCCTGECRMTSEEWETLQDELYRLGV